MARRRSSRSARTAPATPATCRQVEGGLKGTSVLWSRYRDIAELAAGLHTEPLMAHLDQPGIGPHLAPGSPLRLGETSVPPVPAPALGRDTDEVLKDVLSLSRDQVEALRARRITGEA